MAHERITPTAHTIAYLRARAGIPYAPEIGGTARVREATHAFYHRSDFDLDFARFEKLIPWVRLRFLALHAAVRATGITNILELAAGLSPGGLITTKDAGITYLETDLPGMVEEKRAVIERVFGFVPSNLRFKAANALSEQDLRAAADSLPLGPIAFLNEGLLQYFGQHDKVVIAANIRTVLVERGGAWITTDIVRKPDFLGAFAANDYRTRIRTILQEETGCDMAELAFESFEEAESFFKEAGFSVERHLQTALAPTALAGDVLGRHPDLSFQQVWVMRAL